eukprot:scaffold618270_cov38-Prasinocladus_malaysianus.AAC.1
MNNDADEQVEEHVKAGSDETASIKKYIILFGPEITYRVLPSEISSTNRPHGDGALGSVKCQIRADDRGLGTSRPREVDGGAACEANNSL